MTDEELMAEAQDVAAELEPLSSRLLVTLKGLSGDRYDVGMLILLRSVARVYRMIPESDRKAVMAMIKGMVAYLRSLDTRPPPPV